MNSIEPVQTKDQAMKYAIVTPVRNEAGYVSRTLESVSAQTIKPQKWVIVDDASTDNTREIVEGYAAKMPFVSLVEMAPRNSGETSDRVSFGSVPRAFNYGVSFLDLDGLDFIVKLDGDLLFEKDYFSRIFQQFSENPKLGIAGGHCYYQKGARLVWEKVPDDHVRGATKVYRMSCFREIEGVEELLGWDTIDEIKAQAKGWQTRSFRDIVLIHLRPTSSVGGILRGKARLGRGAYFLGYGPLFMAVRLSRQLILKPYLIGSLAMSWGYFSAMLRRIPKYHNKEVVRFLREQQRQRLGLWKKR